MLNVLRRVRKLEGRVDESGFVFGSDAWYDFWVRQAYRLIQGEKIHMKIPYQVFDRVARKAELARQAEGANVSRER
jgi:hypothetical protein